MPVSISTLIFQENDLPGVVTTDFTIRIVDQAVAIVLAEQLKAAFFNTFHLHKSNNTATVHKWLFIYTAILTENCNAKFTAHKEMRHYIRQPVNKENMEAQQM